MSDREPVATGTSLLLKVGDLLIDLAQVRVTRGEEAISLPGLSFDLLVALARTAPRVISQDELMHMVWPGLIVGPDTISQRVKLLRDALGDDPKTPRYIAGMRGRGYQCIAPVSEVARPEPVIPETATQRRNNRMAWLAGAGLFAVLALFALRHFMPAEPENAKTPIPIAVLPFANPDGSEAGRVLAFGIAESVLHQLANLPDLSVISWSSASGIGNESQDVHVIRSQLKVDYVLQGSVQRDAGKLRIMARLVDARTDRSIWSLRLDQRQQDLFAIQDEISLQVARALAVSVSQEGRERLLGQGTRSVEAYLAFLEGQDALSTWRSPAAGIAADHFNRARQLDPDFARAWVMLASARLRDAEFSGGPDQRTRLERAQAEAEPLIQRALVLDPKLGEAYVERGNLRSFVDAAAAEQDYRKAIELTPSSARAHQQLATLIWQERPQSREVADLLERARVLDPLDPALDVVWALYLFYESARVEEAETLLRQVLERHPQYLPAMLRLGELLLMGMGRTVEGIRVLEEVLEQDPASDYARRMLMQGYITVGDLDAARRLARSPEAAGISQMFLALAERRVDQAARFAFEAIDAGTLTGPDQWAAVEAINLDARRRQDFSAAAAAMDEVLDIGWAESGTPVLNPNRGTIGDVLTYAGMLRAAGDEVRATALLNATDEAIDADFRESGRDNRWNTLGRARLALLKGDASSALTVMEGSCANMAGCWYSIYLDPLFEPLRGTPRFQALTADLERRRAENLQALRTH